jgi:TetR/AcrR family transcriptional regulator
MMTRMQQVCAEGCASGELVQVDQLQMMYAALGANVFYFLSAPMMSMLVGLNPFERDALEFRRKAAIEYLGQSLFVDRERGSQAAMRVLESTPMPQSTGTPAHPFDFNKSGNRKIEIDVIKTNEERHK